MKLISTWFLAALASSAAIAAPKPTELRIANVPWHLELSLADMKPIEGYPSRPDRDVFTYKIDEGGILSVIVENAHSPATLAGCRAVFERRKAGMGLTRDVQAQRGDAATQEYNVSFGDPKAMAFQHNVYSCRVRGTYYIDVHAARIHYEPVQEDGLRALVELVKIVE